MHVDPFLRGAATFDQMAIVGEELGSHSVDALYQRIERSRFGGETGNIFARRDPDPGFVIKEGSYHISFGHWVISANDKMSGADM